MTHCTHCHRPMIHPSPDGLGPKCRARLGVEQDGPDLFGYDLNKAERNARQRVHTRITALVAEAHLAVARGFGVARERLGISA